MIDTILSWSPPSHRGEDGRRAGNLYSACQGSFEKRLLQSSRSYLLTVRGIGPGPVVDSLDTSVK